VIRPIIGKKVILFEVEARDIPDFASLHRQDTKGYLQRFSLHKMTQEEAESFVATAFGLGKILAFTIMTKEGKAARRAGYIYITDMDGHGCSVVGCLDKEFLKGLGKQIRKDKYTFSEDAMNTLVKWIFDTLPHVERVQSDVVESNRLSIKLMERCGFTKEGVLRGYLKIEDRLENMTIFSILRNEYKNGKVEETAVNFNPAV
jgi:hypothetical protein